MNILIFKNPKKKLYNIVFACSLICLLICIVAIASIGFKGSLSSVFSSVDKMLPDLYGEKVRKLHSSAINSVTKESKYKSFTQLYQELENISRINKFYHLRAKSAAYLIEHYKSNNNFNKALGIAEKTFNNYPNDFDAKFMYFDVLSKIDSSKSLDFYQDLINKHDDIKEVRKKYLPYIFENHLNKTLIKNYISSKEAQQIYTLDSSSKFVETTLSKSEENNVKSQYANIQGVIINKSLIPENHLVTAIDLQINQDRIMLSKYNHQFIQDGISYQKPCGEPYFIFSIPGHKQYHGNVLRYNSSCKISLANIASKKFLSREWQFFVDSGKSFNQQESVRFKVKNEDQVHRATIEKKYNEIVRIRLDLPSVQGIKIRDFKITIDDSLNYSKKDISNLNNMFNSEEYIETIGKDPFIVINVEDKIVINKVEVELSYFGVLL